MADQILLVGLCVTGVAMVYAQLQILRYDPAPAFFGMSLRRRAVSVLPSVAPLGLFARVRAHSSEGFGWLRLLLYAAVVIGIVHVPWSVGWGPLDDARSSGAFLSTMWQVVAAALGISVAMVAFSFEAFQSAGQRAYGGSLKEFAHESRLVWLIEVGIVALFVDGAVLAGWGHLAPGGWAGAWAILVSSCALVLVGVVVHRVLELLDDRELRQMRTRRVDRLVATAMRQQLTGQAADVWLANSWIGINREFMPPAGSTPIEAGRDGYVYDVRLGPLARWMVRHPGETFSLAVALDESVEVRTPALFWLGRGEQIPRGARRAVRVRKSRKDIPQNALSVALSRLHQQALTACKAGDELEWRAISDSYEQILLALPQAAATWGVPFQGAVAAPGFFGHGPVQKIARFLFDELAAAVEANNRELIGPITYFPQHVAVRAARLGAPALIAPMLNIYPHMYALARRGL